MAAGSQETALLLRLLCCASKPFMHQLHAWLYSGLIDDPAEDFFIAEGEPTTSSHQGDSTLCTRHMQAGYVGHAPCRQNCPLATAVCLGGAEGLSQSFCWQRDAAASVPTKADGRVL